MSPPDSPRENVFPMTSSILISFYLSFSYQIYRVIVNSASKLDQMLNFENSDFVDISRILKMQRFLCGKLTFFMFSKK